MKGWFSMLEKRLRDWLYGHSYRTAEKRASKASHDLANEVMALNAVTSRMSKSGDPWQELAKAIRGCESDRELRH